MKASFRLFQPEKVFDTISALKSEVRSSMRKLLSSLDVSFIKESSLKAQEKIVQSKIFEQASSIALYYPYQNEVNTSSLFEESKKTEKTIAYPKVFKPENLLQFFQVASLSDFVPSSQGLFEPDPGVSLSLIELEKIDLMIIPGLAFDHHGWRIGRGKGFYDKVLKNFFGIRVGLAYSFQVTEKLPHEEEMDEPIHWLATENEFRQVA